MKRRRPSLHILVAFVLIFIFALGPVAPMFSSTAAARPEVDILLVLTGDIMPTRRVADKMESHNDPYLPFRGIENFTKQGDITFGNLETSVSTRGEPADKLYTFRTDPKTLGSIKEAGFDVFTLANNHICDYGPQATQDTMANVEAYGMKHVGLWYGDEPARNATIPRPVIIEAKGVKFAFLGYGDNLTATFLATPESAAPVPDDPSIMKADIEYARTVADVVIASVHWRRIPEYVTTPYPDQVEQCRQMCDWGADIVACHGPHVLQGVEARNGSLIFYSLGNTVFDQTIEKTFRSAIAMVRFKGSRIDSLEMVPIVKNDKHQYIPRGEILKEQYTNDLYLDRSDYEARMFCSDEFITDYEGAVSTWDEIFLSKPALIITIITLVLVLLLLLALLYQRYRKKPCNKS